MYLFGTVSNKAGGKPSHTRPGYRSCRLTEALTTTPTRESVLGSSKIDRIEFNPKLVPSHLNTKVVRSVSRNPERDQLLDRTAWLLLPNQPRRLFP